MSFYANLWGGCLIYCALNWTDRDASAPDRTTLMWGGVVLLVAPVLIQAVLEKDSIFSPTLIVQGQNDENR